MESSSTVSFVHNPLLIHIQGDPEHEMSLLYAVRGEMALVVTEGQLGWIKLSDFTVEAEIIELPKQPMADPGEIETEEPA